MSNIKKSIGKKKKSRIFSNCMHFSSVTDIDKGEILCSGCGLVLLEKTVDSLNPHTGFSKDGYHTNDGKGPLTSLTMYDKGLYTVIGTNKDSSGKMINGNAKSSFSRLRIWDRRSKSDTISRNMARALTTLDGMRSKLGIPENTTEKAAYIFRKAKTKELSKGRDTIPLIAASLYLACRQSGIPRSLNDIADASNVKRKILSRTVRILVKKLGHTLQQYDENTFISRICNSMSISEKTKRGAIEILQKLKKAQYSEGKNPIAIAAASVYVSNLQNNEGIIQIKLAEVAGVSAVTVRNRTFDIKKILKL